MLDSAHASSIKGIERGQSSRGLPTEDCEWSNARSLPRSKPRLKQRVAGVPRCGMKRTHRRRRCPHCKKLFIPDPRSRDRQRFCYAAACRKASKVLSQQRWLAKPENQDHWRGPSEVRRVQEWRKEHPDYWKRGTRRRGTLQDDFRAESALAKSRKRIRKLAPLQDDFLPDDPLLAGIIASLAGSTLQEDIAATCRRLIAVGRDILRRKTTAEAVSSAPKPLNPA